ncbi:MAG: DMT family transporter [Mogibacterium sp.]|nr:DMT family transporter [Mogibacterium sp.]
MNDQTRNVRLAYAAAISAYFIYGLSFIFTRIAMDHTTASILLAVRFTVSLAAMGLLVLFCVAKLDLRGKPLGRFLLMGLCQPVIYYFGETAGVQYTNASFSGIMIAVIPVVTALLSTLLLKEDLPLGKFLWIVVSVFGVTLISITQSSNGVIQPKGILFLLIAVFSASFFSILSKSIAGSFTSFERTFVMMVMGFVVFLGNAVIQEGADFLPLYTGAFRNPSVILPILYLSLISSVVAFFCQNYSMSYLPVTQATIFTNIAPIVSVAAGVLVLSEPFSAIHIVAMILSLFGVYKVTSYKPDAQV